MVMARFSLALAVMAVALGGCRAFQVSSSLRLRATPSSRLLVSRRAPSSGKTPLPPLYPPLPLSALRRIEEEAAEEPEAERPPVEVVDDGATASFGGRLGRALGARPAASFLLSLSILLLPFFLVSAFPGSACAVQSGGRMGGSFGGSSRSYSSPSSGYSRGYSRGYSSGYYSRPNVIVSPGISPFYSPFYNPFTPFYARPSGVVVSTGPSFGSVFFFAGFFLLASLVLSNIGSSVGDSIGDAVGSQSALGPGVSVAEISVALDVPDRDIPNSILSALDRLSRTARTDSRVGLQNLTSQVAMELLRRKSSITAASTRGSHYRDENRALREYNAATIRERGKFQRETVSKYGGVDYGESRPSSRQREYSPKATVAVVTIVMLIDGNSTGKKLSSRVNSIRDVEDALGQIAADAKAGDCLRGAEILWTPEERDETLTMRDVFADYSSLRSV